MDWNNARFDHALYAKWALTGKHAAVTCAQCHTNGNYNNTPTDCYSCHKADFQSTTNPPHVSAGFPTQCGLCHTTAGWTGSTFDHNKTKFPLTGAHVSVACAQCHVNGNYSTFPTDCYGCHQADYKNTNAPPHASSGFPTTCTACHNTSSWTGAGFDHNKTAFPLTGAHTTVACTTCHVNGNYSTLPTDCYGCHTKDYNGTTNPNHKQSNIPTGCVVCHNTTSWNNAQFDHNKTAFPLTGAHSTVPCATCHVNNNFTTLPTDCYGCHQKDFTGTTNPNHVKSGFPNTCQVCHNTTTWMNSTFDHGKTAFPLTGAHKTVACASCHVNNNFTTLPTDCLRMP